MSQTDKLLSTIQEYTSLLDYLNQNYPQVLNQWKNKVAVATNHSSTRQDATIPGVNQNDYRDRINK